MSYPTTAPMVVPPQLYITVAAFIAAYGVTAFQLLLSDKPNAEVAQALGVCESAVSRMRGKFTRNQRLLTDEVIDILQSHFNIQADTLNRERSIIEGQLTLIKGGKHGVSGLDAISETDQDEGSQ
jgi:hypothetical protein